MAAARVPVAPADYVDIKEIRIHRVAETAKPFAKAQIITPAKGLRGVRVKGGKTRDIPLPSAVAKVVQTYVSLVLRKEMDPAAAVVLLHRLD